MTDRLQNETPAETIERAAALMRERAVEMPPPPWHAEGRDVTATQDYDGDFDPDWDCAFNVAVCRRQDEAEHIASWHPLVAAAVAGWLESLNGIPFSEFGPMTEELRHALKIARAYLGEAS